MAIPLDMVLCNNYSGFLMRSDMYLGKLWSILNGIFAGKEGKHEPQRRTNEMEVKR